jgi:predicted AAA+ superfamily ATPase
MSIVSINEIQNPDAKEIAPIKEVQNILIPDIIDKNIPNRNGFIYLLSGAGGSGKTSLLLNMFKSKSMYRMFFTIYIIFVLKLVFYLFQIIPSNHILMSIMNYQLIY